ncbi:hypothetical protein PMAYCL1PPCAC_00725, partial [Pristionchus mayeri]
QFQFVKGVWSGNLDLSSCAGERDDPTAPLDKAITVNAILRDKGGGNVAEATAIFDPFEPRFELVPLRPGIGERANRFTLLSVAADGATGAAITVNASCLPSGGQKFNAMRTEKGKVGDTIQFGTSESWKDGNGVSKCAVIAIQAARHLKDGTFSRRRTLLLPVISASTHLALSWVDPINGVYKAGDQIVIRVDTQGRYAPNYVVHCNGRHQAAAGTLTGSVAPLTINVTPEMKGVCLLAVYTAQGKIEADVLLFIVKEACQHSVTPIGGATRPGAEIAVQLDAPKEGVALLSAIDDRLNWISDKPRTWTDLLPSKFWSYQSSTDSSNCTANLINYKEVENDI